MFKFKISLHKIKSSFLYRLPYKITGHIFNDTYTHLIEYNKTAITLASSTLVLSFTALQLGKLHVNKWLLITSWVFLILVLICGVTTYFLNYLYALISGIVRKKAENKDYEDNRSFYISEEAKYYFWSRLLIYFLSIVQLLFFVIGIILLSIVASEVV